MYCDWSTSYIYHIEHHHYNDSKDVELKSHLNGAWTSSTLDMNIKNTMQNGMTYNGLGRKPSTCNLLSLSSSMAVKCFVCPFSIHIFFSSMINHHSMLSNGLNYKKRKSDKIFPLQHFGQWTWLLLMLYFSCLLCLFNMQYSYLSTDNRLKIYDFHFKEKAL